MDVVVSHYDLSCWRGGEANIWANIVEHTKIKYIYKIFIKGHYTWNMALHILPPQV